MVHPNDFYNGANLSFYGMIQHMQMIFYIGTNYVFLQCDSVDSIIVYDVSKLEFYGMIQHAQMSFYNATKFEFLW